MYRRLAIAAAVLALVFLIVRAAPTPPPSSAALGAIGRGPAVVLVHGLGSDYDDWLPVARDLARDHRVVFVELPGHGLAPMATPFALEQATLALDRAIAEQAREPVVLVGHSVGGLVATAEALHAVYSSFGRDSLQGEQLWTRASQVERQNLRAWIPVALNTDLSSEAAGLAMPVLAVLAPRSWEADESWEHVAQALGYARIPRLRGMRIENCGHFVMLDRPRRLADAIRRFSTNVDSAYALR